MSLQFKSLFFSLLIFSYPFLGNARIAGGANLPDPSIDKAKVEMKMRKLVGIDAMLDYDPPAANPAHDPHKGGSGGGGKGGNK